MLADKEFESELATRYRLIMEACSDALLFVDSQGAIVDANRAAERLYGYSRSELLSLRRGDLCPPGAAEREVGQGAGEEITYEAVHRRRDGSLIDVEISACSSSLGGVPIVLAVVRDITKRSRLEKSLGLARKVDLMLRRGEALDLCLMEVCTGLAGVFNLPLVWMGIKAADGSMQVGAYGGQFGEIVDSLGVRWDHALGGMGPTGKAIRTGATQLTKLEEADAGEPWWPVLSKLGIRGLLAVPVCYRGEVLASVSMYSLSDRKFDRETIEIVEHFAAHLAVVLAEANERDMVRIQTMALNATASAILIFDCSGRITWANAAFSDLTGYPTEEVIGQELSVLKSDLVSDSLWAHLWSTIRAGGTWTGELLSRRRDGTYYVDHQTVTPVRDASGEITHFVAVKADATDRRRQEDHLRYLADHDPLTGVLNRRGFLKRLKQEGSGGSGADALLMVDLDNFKLINDTFGHPVGDAALVTAAGVIRRVVRQDDLAVRYGDDEFAVLLRDVTEADAVRAGERLRRSLQASSIPHANQDLTLSASIGVVMIGGARGTDQVLALADEALAKAKSAGKNKIVFLHPDPERERRARNVWPSRIRSAVAHGNLVLHYQPVVRLHDGGVEFYEALLRMKDSRGSLLFPGEFLPHAFRCGLAPELDLWVIRSVLRSLAANPHLRVAVNLSVQTLQDEDALAAVEQKVIDARPGPGRLIFEIAETAAVRDLQRLNGWIRRMKRLGCRVALDDFGTGASSFEHLRTCDVDVIKVDGSYIQQMLDDRSCRMFVEALSAMCRSMNREVVAEGVESANVAEELRQIGVRLGQGYLWGKPGPIASPAKRSSSQGVG